MRDAGLGTGDWGPGHLPIMLATRHSLLATLALAPLLLAGCESSMATVASQEAASPADNREPADDVAADPARLLEKTFDDIKFDIEPDAPFERSMLTDEIEALAGKRIRIRGYILPTPQKRGIKQFVLVRDNQECCFGPGAALYDCILVQMTEGNTAEFSIRPVAVEGEFDIREFKGPDGRHLAIFHLDGEKVQ